MTLIWNRIEMSRLLSTTLHKQQSVPERPITGKAPDALGAQGKEAKLQYFADYLRRKLSPSKGGPLIGPNHPLLVDKVIWEIVFCWIIFFPSDPLTIVIVTGENIPHRGIVLCLYSKSWRRQSRLLVEKDQECFFGKIQRNDGRNAERLSEIFR